MSNDVTDPGDRIRHIGQRVIVNCWVERWCESDAWCEDVKVGPLAGAFDIDRVHGLGGVGSSVGNRDGVLAAFDWNL